MYHYIEDKKFLSNMREFCGEIMQDTCHILKKEYGIGASFYLVGSGARNLITQDENKPIDLDYNLKIVRCENWNDGKHLKESARKAFDQVLRKEGLKNCEDSHSVLESKNFYFKLQRGNRTPFSIDVCIVKDVGGYTHRLIHQKTGNSADDTYYWNKVRYSEDLKRKADEIKRLGKWLEVREEYLKLKNRYLIVHDEKNHPSFVCYTEAIHNVYSRTGKAVLISLF